MKDYQLRERSRCHSIFRSQECICLLKQKGRGSLRENINRAPELACHVNAGIDANIRTEILGLTVSQQFSFLQHHLLNRYDEAELICIAVAFPDILIDLVANMESLSETPWDVLISGTGLAQSLVAL